MFPLLNIPMFRIVKPISAFTKQALLSTGVYHTIIVRTSVMVSIEINPGESIDPCGFRQHETRADYVRDPPLSSHIGC